MPVKLRDYNNNGILQPEWTEKTFEQREVTVDNMTFATGTNQTRNFADDGIGLAHVKAASNIVQDTVPFGDSRS